MSTTKEIRRLLKPDQVGEQLQLSPHQLKRMRADGTGPKFLRLGHRTIRYAADAVEAWVREQRDES